MYSGDIPDSIWTYGRWNKIESEHTFIDCSVGKNGQGGFPTVWAITKNLTIAKWTRESGWMDDSHPDVTPVQISASTLSEGEVWMRDTEGKLYRRVVVDTDKENTPSLEEHLMLTEGGCPSPAPCPKMVIKTGERKGLGALMSTNSSGEVPTGLAVKWEPVPMTLSKARQGNSQTLLASYLCVGDASSVWALSSSGSIFHWNPKTSSWCHMPSHQATLAGWDAKSASTVYTGETIKFSSIDAYKGEGGEWDLWGVDTKGKLFSRLPYSFSEWNHIDIGCEWKISHVIASSSFNVWAIGTNSLKSTSEYVIRKGHFNSEFSIVQSPPGMFGLSINKEFELWGLCSAPFRSSQANTQSVKDGTMLRMTIRRIKLAPAVAMKKLWDDRGTRGQTGDLGLWAPIPPDGFHALGHFAERSQLERPLDFNFEAPPCSRVSCAREDFDSLNFDPSLDAPLLAHPNGFKMIWNDLGTGGKYGDCSIWEPIPPPGYVAMGHVAARHQKISPNVGDMRCIHESLVQSGIVFLSPSKNPNIPEKMLWSTRGTSASYGYCSVWLVDAPAGGLAPGTFLATSTKGALPERNKVFCFRPETIKQLE